MDFLEIIFPVSGVRTSLLIPPLVAMVIGFVSSLGGLSGAFLILPFQMSIFGYVAPSVSATNFVYNIVGIPGGVAAYIKEKRMNWALAAVITVGTLPGLSIGYYLRVWYLPDPEKFKIFVGLVLLYMGTRLFLDILNKKKALAAPAENIINSKDDLIHMESYGPWKITFTFQGKTYSFRTMPLGLLSFCVGIVGGTYGIGGGALVAPFCVTVLGLPVYTIAGATLLSTFIASIAGVFFYSVLPSPLHTSPDWLLGLLFGLGGLIGMYIGGRVQIRIPQRPIKLALGILLLGLSFKYIFNSL